MCHKDGRSVSRKAVLRNVSGRATIVAIIWCSYQGTCASAYTAGEQRADKTPVPNLREIVDKMQPRWKRIQSLAVEYSVKTDFLAEPSVLKKYMGVRYYPRPKQCSFAFKGEKRHLYKKGPQLAQLIEPESPEKTTLRFAGQLEYAYDGNVIREKQANMLLGGILKHTKQHVDEERFDDLYMGRIGMCMIGVGEEESKHKHERLPDTFTTGSYVVQPAMELVDGSSCVVVFCSGRERIWLDPNIGYAPRRWELIDTKSNLLKERRQFAFFEEIVSGAWLPKVCWIDWCGPASAPDPYRGQPMYRTVLTVANLSVNNVPDERFTLQFEPGIWINDETLVPPADGKERFVIYKMPANPEDLDSVVRNAISRQYGTPWHWPKVGVMVFLGLTMALFLLMVVRRYWRHRRTS